MEDRFVERLLDKTLARLGEHGTEPGLEARILARLQSEPARTQWLDGRWKLAALLAAAAITAAAVVSVFQPRARQENPTVRKTLTVATPRRQPATTPKSKSRRVSKSETPRYPLAATEPRLSVFPSPTPLTRQEKILLNLVEHNDRQALLALAQPASAGPLRPAPLVIKPIKIKPLDDSQNARQDNGTDSQSTLPFDGRR